MIVSNNRICISNYWEYRESLNSQKKVVNLPHCNKEVSYNYFDEKSYQFISYYEKSINVEDTDKRVFLMFEGVMTAFKLSINGNQLEEKRGGYIPHSLEITDYVKKGENKILVEVDSTERKDIPPFGFVIDYLTFGGIYRDVWLYNLDETYIKNIFFKYEVLEHNGKSGKVKCMPIVQLDSKNGEKISVSYSICDKEICTEIDVKKGVNKYTLNQIILEDIDLWSLDEPNLYDCKINLKGKISNDTSSIKLGFRELKIEPDGVKLNGENIKIVGLNRHQSYPYVGYAMPKRGQQEDATILKEELGINTVRCSHYPQSIHFLDKCDEIGLLVLEEIPGWQHIDKSEIWRNQVLEDVRGMIERDYNHPSIITWGVRINESWDDDDLYKKTNELAKELDDTRLTSGVRYMEGSSFFEGIYTMNDFVHNGNEMVLRPRQQCTGLDKEVPYLVTEYCGHIYPTKKVDCEEKLVEHALRHARVQSKSNSSKDLLGAIGWCAFDYNTHFDFGSGDRICYHGVMDMFRMPKFAGYVYKSQKNPKFEYVLEPLTFWARGEKREAIVFPIYVFTNCFSVEIKLNGISKGIFTREAKNLDDKMNGLDFPPIILNVNNGEWGASWTDAEFIGYDESGNEVKNKKFTANPIYSDIKIKKASNVLCTDYLDATRISIEAVDQVSNIMPFISDSLDIEVFGDIEIIGPKRVNFIGGTIAFWIKSKISCKKGKGTVKVKSYFGFEKSFEVDLI